jgi:hypothetical protein
VALALLVRVYPTNGWLWTALLFAALHTLEHVVMMQVYLRTGIVGLTRAAGEWRHRRRQASDPAHEPTLFYNLIETAPLWLGLLQQMRVATGVPDVTTSRLR